MRFDGIPDSADLEKELREAEGSQEELERLESEQRAWMNASQALRELVNLYCKPERWRQKFN